MTECIVPDSPERWEAIIAAPGYEISDVGRVRSWRSLTANGNPKIRSLRVGTDGHVLVNLYVRGVPRHFRVSRLVAQAFLSNSENKPEVNHIDGDKRSNRRQNLEWVTGSENVLHAHKTGLYSHVLSSAQCREICEKYKDKSTYKLAKEYGVSPATIGRVVQDEVAYLRVDR